MSDQEWKDVRIGKFTASEIHKLMKGGSRPMTEDELAAREKGSRKTTTETLFGDGAITYIKEVLHESLTGVAKYVPLTYDMQRGLELEPFAIQAFIEKTGLEVEYYGTTNPKFIQYNAFSGSSPDGETDDAVVEIKCPNAKYMDYLSISKGVVFGEAVPYEGSLNEWLKDYDFGYYCQIQFNMLAAKKKKGYFAAYDNRLISGDHIAILRIAADEEMHADMDMRINAASEILERQLEIFGI